MHTQVKIDIFPFWKNADEQQGKHHPQQKRHTLHFRHHLKRGVSRFFRNSPAWNKKVQTLDHTRTWRWQGTRNSIAPSCAIRSVSERKNSEAFSRRKYIRKNACHNYCILPSRKEQEELPERYKFPRPDSQLRYEQDPLQLLQPPPPPRGLPESMAKPYAVRSIEMSPVCL